MLHFVHLKLQICFTSDRCPSYTNIITSKSTIYNAQWQHLLMNWFISVLYTSFKIAILELSKSINIVWFNCSHYDIFFHVETYIIGHYNPSVRIIDLVSHTTYVVCVNFIHTWRDLQFKVDCRTTDFLRNFS